MRTLAAAAIAALTLTLAAAAAARPPSPALWLWRDSHAPTGELVGVRCHPRAHGRERCLLTVQPSIRSRECWYVELTPRPRGWHVDSVAAVAPPACPILRLTRGGGLGLRQ